MKEEVKEKQRWAARDSALEPHALSCWRPSAGLWQPSQDARADGLEHASAQAPKSEHSTFKF